jgi:hypothetical protein
MHEAIGRRKPGRADPRLLRLLRTYLLGDFVECGRTLGEITTQAGREQRELRERRDAGQHDRLGTDGQITDYDGEILTPLLGAASAEHVVHTREERSDVQVPPELGACAVPMADPTAGGTVLPDHLPPPRAGWSAC